MLFNYINCSIFPLLVGYIQCFHPILAYTPRIFHLLPNFDIKNVGVSLYAGQFKNMYLQSLKSRASTIKGLWHYDVHIMRW